MVFFDIILLIILGIGAFKGYTNGFIVELFSLLAFFIGLFLALEWTIPISINFFGERSYFDFITLLVFIGLFVLFSFLVKSGARLFKKAINITLLGTLDNIVGAISGVFKLALVASVIIWICSSIGIDIQKSYAKESIIFPYLVVFGPTTFEAIGYLFPIIHDLMDSMNNIYHKVLK